ncbi:hypothetical protein PG990_009203 [Apiospora arundinis]
MYPSCHYDVMRSIYRIHEHEADLLFHGEVVDQLSPLTVLGLRASVSEEASCLVRVVPDMLVCASRKAAAMQNQEQALFSKCLLVHAASDNNAPNLLHRWGSKMETASSKCDAAQQIQSRGPRSKGPTDAILLSKPQLIEDFG